ncbi:TPA: LysM peptidoglycan-binding domain-containing protein [Listeria monocytogenes]|uniref:LysM peptidoglycan-binding domain-containing protein n=1 Tax=Listeria TaxID=1637 RepID=UPI000766577C|nr:MULTISPECIES: LysM peptidoglycan-binding domain-containing protein [Listeria]EAC9467728.1 LysM peptidoglycan-binding domain-containing protein [Listeria monocytogenes]EAD0460560.1 LysM peptidoglycan-binding domain-containing protein [Listeria monocytogenes]EAD6997236.1 LysM peptidoglycan-binding domain-containing protein [Listeria monocytogenes]EAD9986471.1 LysM peptidoglycan-binding domain-containing protein [Listeria monocytogenes]EAE3064569.1 LysM peptidoglycan-binding domain-containing 
MSEQKKQKNMKTENFVEVQEKSKESTAKTYVVKEKDRISKVATENKLSVGELVEKNKLTSFKLKTGQKLSL